MTILTATHSEIEQSRITRLRKLVQLNAPDQIIIVESLLVSIAACDNNRFKLGCRLIFDSIERTWGFHFYWPLRRWMHERLGVHWMFEGECVICYRFDEENHKEEENIDGL